MASLNTLRTRGGVVVTIVIGIALLAFLLGDFTPRGCSETSIGKIAGKKIDYVEYTQESEKYTAIYQMMMRKESLSNQESDQAKDMAWQAMIMKYSYQPGFEKMGMGLSEAEEIDMVSGVYISPVLQGMFANQQTGMFDPTELKSFHAMVGSDPSGRAGLMWDYIKQQMIEERVMEKYTALITNAMFVNDLDIDAGMKADNYTYSARVVAQQYSQVPDSLVKISSSDIKGYYDLHKNSFHKEAARTLEYVVFDLLPSQSDYEDSEKLITGIAEEFKESHTPMSYATLNSQVRPDQRYLSEDQIADATIAAAVWGKPESIYGPVLSGDVYTIARQGEMKMLPDSIGANNIVVNASNRSLADSIATAIRAGADFTTLAVQHSLDQNAAVNGGKMGTFSPDDLHQFSPKMTEALLEAKIGEINIVPEGEVLHIAQLTYKSPLVRKAQIAIIKYNVEPSSETQQRTYAEASTFLTEATGSYDNFKKAVADNVLVKKMAHIGNSDREVYGLDDSRELVRWAHTAKAGTVSDIMELGGDYVIAALTSVQEAGLASVDQVADDIRPMVMRQKKGELIAKKLLGANIDEMANNLGVEPIQIEGVGFNEFQINDIGVEQRLIGALSGAEQGKLSKPVFGESGVFMFEVDNTEVSEVSTKESIRVMQESILTGYMIQRIGIALLDVAKIEDNRVKFF